MSEWKESTGNAWKPTKEGDEVEGLLIGVEENVGANGSKMYHLELADHTTLDIWGTTVLDMRMAVVKVGEEVRIIYDGLAEKATGGKQKAKLFRVFHRMPEA